MATTNFRPSLSWLLALLIGWVLISFPGHDPAAAAGSDQEPEPFPKDGVRYPSGELRVHPLRQKASFSPTGPVQSDNFGYTLDGGAPFTWMDATAGTAIVFDGSDDSFAGPIDIGFDFPFYENFHTAVYINTNGTLNFAEGSADFANQPMPQDSPPNDLLAPFWDDLVVGGDFNDGQVFTLAGGTAPARYFVIEWHEVTRLGSSDLLTFETILHENGDIHFQYLDLNGVLNDATVGMEDRDGVDGLLYLHNAPGLSSSQAIHILRPPPGPRVKFDRVYQSGLTAGGQYSYEVLVRNTGESGADTFDLSADIQNPGWTAVLYPAGSQNPLADTDGDNVVDTGLLLQGSALTLTVNVTAPQSYTVGASTAITLSAQSSLDPAKSADVRLETAVPAAFAQGFLDNQLGMRLDLVWEHNRRTPKVADHGGRGSLALTSIPSGEYVIAWEKTGFNGTVVFANIEYAILDRFGNILQGVQALDDHQNASLQTTDRFPALTAAGDGRIGLVWIRDQFDHTIFKTNSNVYFAILDSQGALIGAPINVTQNVEWRGDGDLDVPTFTSPRLTATEDNSFFLTWIDGRQQSVGETSDLVYRVFDNVGNPLNDSENLTQSVAGSIRYLDPALASLGSDQIFAAYTIFDPASIEYTIAYVALDSSGNWIQTETLVTGSQGWGPDVIHLTSGELFLAWKDPVEEKIQFAILEDSGFSLLAGPTALDNPDARPADFVSVTLDSNSQVVLTWMDAGWNQRLYYALVTPSGETLTPPLVLRSSPSASALVISSLAGQGGAFYSGSWQLFLPLSVR